MIKLPCSHVLAAPEGGPILTCGHTVYVGTTGGAPLCHKHTQTDHFVYVIRRGEHIKIGTTYRPEQRLRDLLQVG